VALKRKPSLSVVTRNENILQSIKDLKLKHPFWGYRRVWAHLTYHQHFAVGKKRVYRLMRLHNLLVKETRSIKAKRVKYPSKLRVARPNHIWGTDMTKVKLPHIGWAYIVIVLDWHTKKIVGYSIAMRSKTQDWLEALYAACQLQFPAGIRSYEQLALVSDNGCQPTSERFMRECNTLGIKQIFTSFCNPKGNADTERMMRTMKEELVWSNDWQSYDELAAALDTWVEEYNTKYCHSSLGYLPPAVFEKKQLLLSLQTPLVAA